MIETQTERPAAAHEEGIYQIGSVASLLVRLCPDELGKIVQVYKDAYQGKRLDIQGHGVWDVVEVFADASNRAKIMARLRRVKGGQ